MRSQRQLGCIFWLNNGASDANALKDWRVRFIFKKIKTKTIIVYNDDQDHDVNDNKPWFLMGPQDTTTKPDILQ